MSDYSHRRDYSYRHFRFDAENLYNHLLDLRREESPGAVVERLRGLLIDGANYDEPEVLKALHRIAISPWSEQEFTLILNRCCYILINYWWLHSEFKQATIDLVSIFEPPYPVARSTQENHRLRELISQFTQTEQFAELQDRARIVDENPKTENELKISPSAISFPAIHTSIPTAC